MSNAAFFNGFDDQEQNLTFVRTDFQVLEHKYHACIYMQAFYPLISRNLNNIKIFLYKLFVRSLVVKPACVNVA